MAHVINVVSKRFLVRILVLWNRIYVLDKILSLFRKCQTKVRPEHDGKDSYRTGQEFSLPVFRHDIDSHRHERCALGAFNMITGWSIIVVLFMDDLDERIIVSVYNAPIEILE